jgi:hypothetical protein
MRITAFAIKKGRYKISYKKTTVMRRIIAMLFCFTASQISYAQSGAPCGFEKLFTFQPGMNKMMVLDSVNKTYNMPIVNRFIKKRPAYKGTTGDSIIEETIVYNIEKSVCLRGRRSTLQLFFADDKLFKAYLSTLYDKSNYQELVSNFNSLRGNIKPHWEFENEVKLNGKNTIGFGYDYTRTNKVTNKTEKVTLQYVDLKTQNAHNPYLLEVIWANLQNTRMQDSSY